MKQRRLAIYQLLLGLEDLLLSLVLGGMILLAGGQILLRNLFDYSLSWGDPTLRLMVLWIALLGAMVATRDNHHIRIDLLSRYLSPALKRISDLISGLFSSLVCLLLCWHSARLVGFEYQDGSRFLDEIPLWPLQLILPIGFGIIALRLLFNALFVSQDKQP